ncbi:hypothetical protein J4573_45325 [Actinomadura barringtoniae]|uniref:Uncharacterized protein n=1 Tax=Actinomadura barringtoniae TaxID=1427535 RepID=A0A939PKD6_9ACTN|nr:hypothetical protein [Actinomadura barringtoniae]MBO2454376.1 hypothetical protein [Actinomadura barringtoniae]
MRRVLLLGRSEAVVEAARAGAAGAAFEIVGGTGLDDLRAVFAQGPVAHVIMGAGLDLETRLAVIREIFETSDVTTVHMKDSESGAEGFLPFIQAVLGGLEGWV